MSDHDNAVPERVLALRMVIMKFMMDCVAPAQRELRKLAELSLAAKDRVTAVSPLDGTVLGTITKSNPSPTATVDERVFADWMSANYPERVTWQSRITAMEAAIAVLRVHAPELLESSVVVAPYAVAEVQRLSAAAGRPVGPGGELDVPGITVGTKPGVVSVRTEATAADAIAGLITSGRVTLDGRELPGGAS